MYSVSLSYSTSQLHLALLISDRLPVNLDKISRDGIVKGAHVAIIQLRGAPGSIYPGKGENLMRPSRPRTIAIIARPVVIRRGVAPRLRGDAPGPGRHAGGDEPLDAAGQHSVAADVDPQPLVDLGPEREVPLRQDLGRAVREQGIRVLRRVVLPRARRVVPAGDGEGVDVVVPVARDAADVRVREGLRPLHRPRRPLRLHERPDGHRARHGEVVLERLVGAGGVLREALRERDRGRPSGQTTDVARRDGAGVIEPDEDLPSDIPLVVRGGRQRGGGPAVVDEADDLDLERVRLAVAEQRQERRDVDLVLADVEGLDAHDRPVQLRHHAARVDDGERPRHAGQVPVDEHLHLAERRVTRVLAVRGLEGARGALRHVAPPELLVALPLDVDGEDGAVRVAREVGHGDRRLLRGVHELAGLAGGAEALRDGDDEVGRGPGPRRGVARGRGRGPEEGRRERRVEEPRVRPVDDVLEVEDHRLRLLPERAEGRHVLEPLPADAVARRLRRGRPPHLRVAEVHDTRAVVLPSPHERREVDDYVVEGALWRHVLPCVAYVMSAHIHTRGWSRGAIFATQL